MNQRIPVIDCTDLYRPHQDVGDNFDLVLPYALSNEIDLRGVVPEEMIPVDVKVGDDGHFEATPTSQATTFRLYHRPDPAANQAALRDALPALYLSFRSH